MTAFYHAFEGFQINDGLILFKFSLLKFYPQSVTDPGLYRMDGPEVNLWCIEILTTPWDLSHRVNTG